MSRNSDKVIAQGRVTRYIEKPSTKLLEQLSGLGIDPQVVAFRDAVLALKSAVDELPDDVKRRRGDPVLFLSEGAAPAAPAQAEQPPQPEDAPAESGLDRLVLHAIYDTNALGFEGGMVMYLGPSDTPGHAVCGYKDAQGNDQMIKLEPGRLGQRLG